jgi:uncharacterized BrkB/YihY/UPF0761 family membrane protein
MMVFKEESDDFKTLVDFLLPAFLLLFSLYFWGEATQNDIALNAKILVLVTSFGLISLYFALPIKTNWKIRVVSCCVMTSLIIISFSAALNPLV